MALCLLVLRSTSCARTVIVVRTVEPRRRTAARACEASRSGGLPPPVDPRVAAPLNERKRQVGDPGRPGAIRPMHLHHRPDHAHHSPGSHPHLGSPSARHPRCADRGTVGWAGQVRGRHPLPRLEQSHEGPTASRPASGCGGDACDPEAWADRVNLSRKRHRAVRTGLQQKSASAARWGEP